MIAGIFHEGSGIGNQLHRYVATRILAEKKGYEWGMLNACLFKGSNFMKLDTGKTEIPTTLNRWEEKKVVENGVDIRSYDPEFNFIPDNTIIDGEFQDERYFEDRLSDVDKWLDVEPMPIADNLCIIGFRGGEFTAFPDLFLTKEYWQEAIDIMKSEVFNVRFQVHTDDLKTAKEFFPDFECIHEPGINWRSMRFAKYAIIANSSFYILPRLLSGETTIAPRFWARRNTRIWALPQNYYKSFRYI